MLSRALRSRTAVARTLTPRMAPAVRGLADSAEPAAPPKEEVAEAPGPNRMLVTLEVIVSKIFPAGFGWQASSVVAGDMGFEADSLNFALTTGAGDFTGVLVGHSTYSILNAMVGRGGGLGSDLVGGLWLASAVSGGSLARIPPARLPPIPLDSPRTALSTTRAHQCLYPSLPLAGLLLGRGLAADRQLPARRGGLHLRPDGGHLRRCHRHLLLPRPPRRPRPLQAARLARHGLRQPVRRCDALRLNRRGDR